jgi:hypothetical protein
MCSETRAGHPSSPGGNKGRCVDHHAVSDGCMRSWHAGVERGVDGG